MSSPAVESTINSETLLLMVGHVKRLDMQISLDIASLANCTVRDNHGNLLPFVWTRQSVHNEHENASLLTRDALQKQMIHFIESTANDNLKMLQKVSDPALLVDWVVRTAEHWERRYAQKRDEKYDISQPVFAVMLETITEQIIPAFQAFYESEFAALQAILTSKFEMLSRHPGENPYHMLLLQKISAERQSAQNQNLESFFWLHRGHHALIRFFFRLGLQLGAHDNDTSQNVEYTDLPVSKRQKTSSATSRASLTSNLVFDFLQHICVMAGKLLQKKEVCNKAGAYSSNRQRSDVLQEYNNAVLGFRMWVQSINGKTLIEELHARLDSSTWLFFVIDHTSVPVSLSQIRAVKPKLDLLETVVCPHCNASFVQQADDASDSTHIK
jgi:hypothetical protein